jgi:hypothetical protein
MIQAIMTYFQHWGVEEARLRRRNDGIRLLMERIVLKLNKG